MRPLTSTLEKLRREDQKFKVVLSYRFDISLGNPRSCLKFKKRRKEEGKRGLKWCPVQYWEGLAVYGITDLTSASRDHRAMQLFLLEQGVLLDPSSLMCLFLLLDVATQAISELISGMFHVLQNINKYPSIVAILSILLATL